MDVEADDRVHDRLRDDIGRDVTSDAIDHVAHRVDATLFEEERTDGVRALEGEDAHDDLALRDEASVAADEIALADAKIGIERRIGGVGDANDRRAHREKRRTRSGCSGRIASISARGGISNRAKSNAGATVQPQSE